MDLPFVPQVSQATCTLENLCTGSPLAWKVLSLGLHIPLFRSELKCPSRPTYPKWPTTCPHPMSSGHHIILWCFLQSTVVLFIYSVYRHSTQWECKFWGPESSVLATSKFLGLKIALVYHACPLNLEEGRERKKEGGRGDKGWINQWSQPSSQTCPPRFTSPYHLLPVTTGSVPLTNHLWVSEHLNCSSSQKSFSLSLFITHVAWSNMPRLLLLINF